MTSSNEIEFVPLCIGRGFEISTSYPYIIRNRCYTATVSYNGHGYPQVKLSGKHYYIHRLVAMQFILNPDNKRTVRHINGDRTDYHISNLIWR